MMEEVRDDGGGARRAASGSAKLLQKCETWFAGRLRSSYREAVPRVKSTADTPRIPGYSS